MEDIQSQLINIATNKESYSKREKEIVDLSLAGLGRTVCLLR
jgi:hypothetical protein